MAQDTGYQPATTVTPTVAMQTPIAPGRSAGDSTGPRMGQLVGPYALWERIGRGGLGFVYRAYHSDSGEEVALKLLRGGEDATPAELRSMQREIEAARRLDHPGILPILDAGRHDGVPYFTMPLIAGGNLETRLRDGRPEPRVGVALLARVARAVHAAHVRGVIHRDLKPANILLGPGDAPLVADFGLARLVDQATAHTMTGQVMGSLPYMSPEQAAGKSHLATPATDVWSMGVMLYELLTGTKPFHGDGVTEVLRRIQFDEPVAPRLVRGNVPADLEAVCLRCLRKNPRRRYATADDLADDLERWLAGEPVRSALASGRPVAASPRKALAAGAALLFAVTWLLTALVSPEPAQSAEQVARARLRRHLATATPGRPVELLSLKRRPIWARIVCGDDQTKFTLHSPQPAWLHTPDRCLLELLPADPIRTAYRLTIELSVERSGRLTLAGLYAGHRHETIHVQPGQPIEVHAFVEAVFPERQAKGPGVALNYTGFIDHPVGRVTSHCYQIGHHVDLPVLAVPLRQQVRLFALEIRGSRVGIDAGQATRWPRPVREKMAFEGLASSTELHGVRPALSPTAPAGIVLWHGAIRVYRVLYEPLPAPR